MLIMASSVHVFVLLYTFCALATCDDFLSNIHGKTGGVYYNVLDQGRINHMEWGRGAYGVLGITNFDSDARTSTQTAFGSGSGCTPFTLEVNDYIVGYKIYNATVWLGGDAIFGLQFTTHNGQTYSCLCGECDPTKSGSYSTLFGDYQTFEYYDANFLLIGWNIWAGEFIDAIQFQFASFDSLITTTEATSAPVLETTTPTLSEDLTWNRSSSVNITLTILDSAVPIARVINATTKTIDAYFPGEPLVVVDITTINGTTIVVFYIYELEEDSMHDLDETELEMAVTDDLEEEGFGEINVSVTKNKSPPNPSTSPQLLILYIGIGVAVCLISCALIMMKACSRREPTMKRSIYSVDVIPVQPGSLTQVRSVSSIEDVDSKVVYLDDEEDIDDGAEEQKKEPQPGMGATTISTPISNFEIELAQVLQQRQTTAGQVETSGQGETTNGAIDGDIIVLEEDVVPNDVAGEEDATVPVNVSHETATGGETGTSP